MWRMWTKGWGPRAWWYWFRVEGFPIWFVWKLPRHLAYWAFIRVYSADGQGPGPEFERVCRAWESGKGR
jgi:hypothetical protein